MTKADMAERLYEELGLNKREAKELVEMFFEEVRSALESGDQVKLSGFGNFDLRNKNERPDRNPKTGEEIPITARRVVTFRPGQKLKARVEAFGGEGVEGVSDYEAEDDDQPPRDNGENPAQSGPLGADIAFGMRALDGGTE